MSLGKSIVSLLLLVFIGATLLGQPIRVEHAPDSKPGPEELEQKEPRSVELDEDTEQRVAKFMRRKLSASGDVVEGLVTEDFEMIEKGAKAMAKMSRASDWQMIDEPAYTGFSNQFRKACDDLVEAADRENLDGAGFAYMRVTMHCIVCHKYVRKTMGKSIPAAPTSR